MSVNRFVRDSVKERVGVEYLISHQVSDIPSNIMAEIKREAFEKFMPNKDPNDKKFLVNFYGSINI